jgi:hypothetical protein
MQPWLRYGLIGGGASALITAILAVISFVLATGGACNRHSPRTIGDLGFIIFLGLMGYVGYTSARAGETVGRASLAGLTGGLLSGAGVVVGFLLNLPYVRGQIACVSASLGNTNGVDLTAASTSLGVIALIIAILLGMGIGAGAAAIGGLIGRPARDL